MRDKKDSKLPATQSVADRTPTIFVPQPRHTGGLVDTWLTGWEAKRKTAAHNQLAALNRAKANELNAYREMAEAYISTAKTVHQLDELPEILGLDRAERQAARAGKYAALEQERQDRERRVAQQPGERQHQDKITELRRKRETTAAEFASFNAERGLQNLMNLHKLDEELWQTQKQVRILDAKAEAAALGAALDDHAEATSSSHFGGDPIAEVFAARAEAIADGRDSGPYDTVIAALVAKSRIQI